METGYPVVWVPMKFLLASLLVGMPLGLSGCKNSGTEDLRLQEEDDLADCSTPADREALGVFEEGMVFPAPLDDGYSTGVTVGDINGDGLRDVWLPTSSRPQVFIQQADGTFVDEWERLPLTSFENMNLRIQVISLIDIDGDLDLDAVVGRKGDYNRILENMGDGVFERVEETGVETGGLAIRSFSWGDMDSDGDLDLVVANDRYGEGPIPPDPGHPNKLFERVGVWEWVDVSDRLGETWTHGYSKFIPWFDYNDDGHMDLYMINHMHQFTGNHLLQNDGTGHFSEVMGTGLDLTMSGMGFDMADLNGDRSPDLLISDQSAVKMMMSDGQGGWYDAALALGLVVSVSDARHTAWSSTWSDLDNDGLVDVITSFAPTTEAGYDTGESQVQEQRDSIWQQNPEGTFTDVSGDWGMDHTAPNRAVVAVDLNQDGWLDIIKSEHRGPTVLFMARCGFQAWLIVELRGPTDNPHGIGARVTIEHGDRTQTRWIRNMAPGYLSNLPHEVHFGLGDSETVDRLTVDWPDGTKTRLEDVDTRRALEITWEATEGD